MKLLIPHDLLYVNNNHYYLNKLDVDITDYDSKCDFFSKISCNHDIIIMYIDKLGEDAFLKANDIYSYFSDYNLNHNTMIAVYKSIDCLFRINRQRYLFNHVLKFNSVKLIKTIMEITINERKFNHIGDSQSIRVNQATYMAKG